MLAADIKRIKSFRIIYFLDTGNNRLNINIARTGSEVKELVRLINQVLSIIDIIKGANCEECLNCTYWVCKSLN